MLRRRPWSFCMDCAVHATLSTTRAHLLTPVAAWAEPRLMSAPRAGPLHPPYQMLLAFQIPARPQDAGSAAEPGVQGGHCQPSVQGTRPLPAALLLAALAHQPPA